MKTNKNQNIGNFNGLGPRKGKSAIQGKKHHKQVRQVVRTNIKGYNLHDLIKKVA